MNRRLIDVEIIALGKRLKELREKLGLTQQEFANKLFWDVSSYQMIESGKAPMTSDKAVQFHRDYNVDLNYFITGDSVGNEDTITNTLVNCLKQDNAGMVHRLSEYLIRLITMRPKTENV